MKDIGVILERQNKSQKVSILFLGFHFEFQVVQHTSNNSLCIAIERFKLAMLQVKDVEAQFMELLKTYEEYTLILLETIIAPVNKCLTPPPIPTSYYLICVLHSRILG